MRISGLLEIAGHLASELGWTGVPVAISGLESPVVALAVIDDQEHEARCMQECGPIVDLTALAALWELPHGIAVPLSALPGAARRKLGTLSPSAVRVADRSAERRVRPPARIAGVLAPAGTWRRSATALGAFVTVAPRVVVLSQTEAVSDRMSAEALVWEIGLVREGGYLEMLLEPGSASVEHGPFEWWLAERAYAAWMAGVTGRPRPPVAA